MEDFKVPSTEIEDRTKRIQSLLCENNIDGMLIIQRADLFYFSGTAQNAFLYIPSEGEPLLMVKKYMPRAQNESPLKNITEINSVKELPGIITDFYSNLPHVIGFEFDVLPVKDFNFYRSLLQVREYVDASPLIHQVRMIKSNWEIEQIEKTAEISQKTFEYIGSVIRAGYTEMELSGLYETFARKLGHSGYLMSRHYQAAAYNWHILSGKSGSMVGFIDTPASGAGTSAAFPCGAGNKRLSVNEPVMIDLGTVLNGYHVDETRMFAIGSMPDKAVKACDASIEIHNNILEIAKPGISLGELFQVSVSRAKSLGYSSQYLGPPGYKVTFIGHGVGLELVENPIIARNREQPLETGMVFSLEPKMVFKDEFSAGIESVFVVTETGSRLISKVPVEIFIC